MHAASLIGEGAALAAEVFEFAVEFSETPVEFAACRFEPSALLAEHGPVFTDRVDMVMVHERTPSDRTKQWEPSSVWVGSNPSKPIVLAPYDNEPKPPTGTHVERPLRLALTLPVRTRSTLWRFARVESISIRPEQTRIDDTVGPR